MKREAGKYFHKIKERKNKIRKIQRRILQTHTGISTFLSLSKVAKIGGSCMESDRMGWLYVILRLVSISVSFFPHFDQPPLNPDPIKNKGKTYSSLNFHMREQLEE
jgi:hypothetical protein